MRTASFHAYRTPWDGRVVRYAFADRNRSRCRRLRNLGRLLAVWRAL